MSFKILYVTATPAEAGAFKRIKGLLPLSDEYRFGTFEISLLVTGVGSAATAWSMKQWISSNEKPDLVINGGIAGSYRIDLKIGDVVMPATDCFADAGVEDGENFLTMSEAGLISANEFPFRDGLLYANSLFNFQVKSILRPVKAITVNSATGSEATILRMQKKFNPDIETMEGATFFYICARENLPFLALRAISNMVEPRNKNNWNIPLALESLSTKLYEVILTLD